MILKRKESYNHNTTAKVEWLLIFDNGIVYRRCKTKKEALHLLSLYQSTFN
jgi:hypothetical protein